MRLQCVDKHDAVMICQLFHVVRLISTYIEALICNLKIHILILRSSAERYDSPSEFTDTELM